MNKERIAELTRIASEVRKDIIRMVGVARSGPVDAPLAIADLLVYLYWEELLVLADRQQRNDRDRFLSGSANGTPALYAVLARRGFFEREELWHYKRLGAMLQPLPDFARVPGVDAPCVLSGSELSIAAGIMESLIRSGSESRVYCLVGESDCGNLDFWLEAESIGAKKYGNMILLLVLRKGENAEPYPAAAAIYEKKFVEAGWDVNFADGHDFEEMAGTFAGLCEKGQGPKVVFISVKMGKGLSFAELRDAKYSKSLGAQEMDRALEELEAESNGG